MSQNQRKFYSTKEKLAILQKMREIVAFDVCNAAQNELLINFRNNVSIILNNFVKTPELREKLFKAIDKQAYALAVEALYQGASIPFNLMSAVTNPKDFIEGVNSNDGGQQDTKGTRLGDDHNADGGRDGRSEGGHGRNGDSGGDDITSDIPRRN